MKKNKQLPLIFILILVLAIILFFSLKKDSTTSVEQEKIQEKTFTVEVETTSPQPYQSFIVLPATTQAIRSLKISAKRSGQITKITKKEGETLPKGFVLAKINLESLPDDKKKLEKKIKYLHLQKKTEKKLSEKGLSSLSKKLLLDVQLAEAESALSTIKVEIEKSSISMPFQGNLEKTFVEVGSFVQKGDPVAYIIDLSRIKVMLKIPENLWEDVQQATTAFLILPNGSEKKASIAYVGYSANESTHTYDAELLVSNENNHIPQGKSVQAKIYLKKSMANKISHQALTLNTQGQLGVKVVTSKNTVAFVPVSILKDEKSCVWVTGLPKEKVNLIINGQEYVLTGQKVIAKNKK